MRLLLFILNALAFNCVVGLEIARRKPAIVYSSETFTKQHVPPNGFHPECPERVAAVLNNLRLSPDKYDIRQPSLESDPQQRPVALSAIKLAHEEDYIKDVFRRSMGGATGLSPWDTDTYLSKDTFETCVLAQSAWLDGLRAVTGHGNDNARRFAFAITRPPGHHAEIKSGMGFCVFNFAAGAALYALNHGLVQRVAILDIDVHYGNGIADIVQIKDERIRYASLHQEQIYPGPVPEGVQPSSFNNVLTVNLPAGFKIGEYLKALKEKAIPFLADFGAELLIVSAGFDAIYSEESASGGLKPNDYAAISAVLKDSFRGGVLYGLEGGYVLKDLPLAVEASIEPWI
jgi:acetoin utilization deacetylase AcuC-like enzyme